MKFRHFCIILNIIFFGVYAILGQTIIVRELLSISQGNELTIGMSLGIFFLWIALGSFFSSRFLVNSKNRIIVYIFLLTILLAILLPLTVFSVAFVKNIFDVHPIEILSIIDVFLFSLFLLFPLCFTSGCIFPLYVEYLRPHYPEKNSVSLVYILESAGSGLLALPVYLYIIPRWQPINISFLVSSILILGVIFTIFSHKKNITLRLISVLTFLLFGYVSTSSDVHDVRKKIQWGVMNFAAGQSTRHGYLEVVEIADQINIYENGALSFSSDNHLSAFNLFNIVKLQHSNIDRVLFLGGNPLSTRKIAESNQSIMFEHIDLNSKVFALLDSYVFNSKNSYSQKEIENLSFIASDDRNFLRQNQNKYDVIVLSKPLPSSLSLNGVYSEEYYRLISSSLAHEGTLIFEIPSSPYHLTSNHLRFLSLLNKTVKKAFSSVFLIPGETCIFVASNNKSFALNVGNSQNPEEKYYYDILFRKFNPVSSQQLRNLLENYSSEVDVSRDFTPSAYIHNMLQSLESFQSPLLKFVRFFTKLNTYYFYIPIGVFFMIVLYSCLKRNNQKIMFSFTAFSFGLTAISCQIILMLVMQVVFGQLFYQLGILSSCFMMGVFAGSFCIFKLGSSTSKKYVSLFIAIMLCFSIAPLLVKSLLIDVASSIIVFYFFSVLLGYLLGTFYPIATELSKRQLVRSDARAAGSIYAYDLIGACCGSIFVVPITTAVLGFSQTCLWLSCLNLFCFLAFLINYRFNKYFNLQ